MGPIHVDISIGSSRLQQPKVEKKHHAKSDKTTLLKPVAAELLENSYIKVPNIVDYSNICDVIIVRKF